MKQCLLLGWYSDRVYQQKVEPSRVGGFGVYATNLEDRWAHENGATNRPDLSRGGGRLHAGDVSGLEPFGTLSQLELDGFALSQTPISALLNCRKMHEHIFPCGALNESVAFGSVEPLDRALLSH